MESFIGQFGYAAIAFLIFAETVFPPIPSEVILPLAGFLTAGTDMTLPGVIAASTLGALLGAYVLYGVGRLVKRQQLETLFSTRPARLLGFKVSDIARVLNWFDHRGQITVLICRCIPSLRSLISIPAGTAHMGLVRFSILTLVGSCLWNTLLCSLGAAAGSAWQSASDQIAWATDAAKVVLVVAIAAACVWWLVFRARPAWHEAFQSAKPPKAAR